MRPLAFERAGSRSSEWALKRNSCVGKRLT